MKKCPYCAEHIQEETNICRYYGKELTRQPAPPSAPQAGLAKSPRQLKNESNLALYFILAIVFSFLGVHVLSGCSRGGGAGGVGGGGVTVSPHSAHYLVTGNGSANLVYENATAGRAQESVTLPWSDYFDSVTSGELLYISAQLNGVGDIGCQILIDQKVVDSAHSSGQFVIATCNTSVP